MAVIVFIFILAVLVLVHEWGHFIVAKKSGIRVDEFGIGFPPRAKKLFTKNGTLFSLNWIPFGGFVKIYGENSIDVNPKDRSSSFVSKSKWTQAAVLFAGPFMNILFAFVVFSATFMVGIPMIYDESNASSFTETSIIITGISEDSPAESIGLELGDVVSEIGLCCEDTFEVTESQDVSSFVASSGERELKLKIIRGKELLEFAVTPKLGLAGNESTPLIGFSMEKIGIARFGFFESIGRGFERTGQIFYEVVYFLFDLIRDAFRGEADLSGVTGPVGIASVVGDAMQVGLSFVLVITALISVNLAVINLLPFPALDGGRLLFIGIEAVTGRPIKPAFISFVNTAGFLILIGLMLLVTYRDIINL